jgi:hypothetical protein
MLIGQITTLLLCIALSFQDIIPRYNSKIPWPTHDYNGVNVGTQRVSVIAHASDAVWAHLPWRRRDLSAGKSTVIVLDDNGQMINNSILAQSNHEFGEVVFQVPRSSEFEIVRFLIHYSNIEVVLSSLSSVL